VGECRVTPLPRAEYRLHGLVPFPNFVSTHGPAAPAVWANSLLGSSVTATATATAAVTASALTASAGAAMGSFIDPNSSSIEPKGWRHVGTQSRSLLIKLGCFQRGEDLLLAIQSSNCCVGFRFLSKRDESVSAAPLSITVFRYYLLRISIR
jgi:hypothetical protein